MDTKNIKLPTLNPTLGEHYTLTRRRAGLTQYQQAVNLCMSLKTYARLEHNGEPVREGLTELGELAPHEYYYLLRRRAGISQTDIADRMDVSKAFISQAELGHQTPEVLERYWKAYHADN